MKNTMIEYQYKIKCENCKKIVKFTNQEHRGFYTFNREIREYIYKHYGSEDPLICPNCGEELINYGIK